MPRKILQENPRQNPPNFIQQKSPTHFCRGAGPRIFPEFLPESATRTGGIWPALSKVVSSDDDDDDEEGQASSSHHDVIVEAEIDLLDDYDLGEGLWAKRNYPEPFPHELRILRCSLVSEDIRGEESKIPCFIVFFFDISPPNFRGYGLTGCDWL